MATLNPLNGLEALKYVLSKIEQSLEESGEFNQGITFPWFKFSYKVDLLVYPKQGLKDEPVVVAKGEEVRLDTDELRISVPAKEISAQDSVVVDIPDQARVESDQPLPTPGLSDTGVMVDKLVQPKEPKTKHKGK